MHIVFITHEFPTANNSQGGVGTFVHKLGTALVQAGHAVSVVGFYKNNLGNSIEEGINVFRLPFAKGRFKFWKHARRLNTALLKIDKRNIIDIVEGPELSLAFLKKNPHIKYVVRMHGGHHFFALAENRKTEPWKVFQEKRSFAKADAICAVSHYVAETTKNLVSLKEQPIRIIYNPIDTGLFTQVDYSKAHANRILYVGSLVEKKGVRQLILAMPQIVALIPDAELFLVGRIGNIPGTSQSYETVLLAAVPDELKHRIHLTGAVPHAQIPMYIERAEVCVYPSHMEAMPIAWLEALAMGKPLVGSNTGPGPEAVTDGETGLLCDPHNPADIADKVIWMLQNKEAAQKMGIAARTDISHRFNINSLVNANIDFYQSLLQTNGLYCWGLSL